MEQQEKIDVDQAKQRNFFRVDDVLPILVSKAELEMQYVKSRILYGFQSIGQSPHSELPPDESIPPALWKMLLDIQSKLNLVLDVFHPEAQKLSQATPLPLSLSASGIRLNTEHPLELGELVEVRILLQLQYPLWLLLYGHVVKKSVVSGTIHDMAIHFCDMDEEIRDKISQYCLKRQRELIREQRNNQP